VTKVTDYKNHIVINVSSSNDVLDTANISLELNKDIAFVPFRGNQV